MFPGAFGDTRLQKYVGRTSPLDSCSYWCGQEEGAFISDMTQTREKGERILNAMVEDILVFLKAFRDYRV